MGHDRATIKRVLAAVGASLRRVSPVEKKGLVWKKKKTLKGPISTCVVIMSSASHITVRPVRSPCGC